MGLLKDISLLSKDYQRGVKKGYIKAGKGKAPNTGQVTHFIVVNKNAPDHYTEVANAYMRIYRMLAKATTWLRLMSGLLAFSIGIKIIMM